MPKFIFCFLLCLILLLPYIIQEQLYSGQLEIQKFHPSTKETAETAASPTLATITVSKKPTKITNNCSITSGTINLFKSLLVNNTHNRPLHRPIIRLSILDSKLFLFLKHKNYFNLAHNSIKQLSSKGLKYFCTNKLSGVKL